MPGLLPTPGALGVWGQGGGKGQPAKVRGFDQAPSLEDPATATLWACAPLCPPRCRQKQHNLKAALASPPRKTGPGPKPTDVKSSLAPAEPARDGFGLMRAHQSYQSSRNAKQRVAQPEVFVWPRCYSAWEPQVLNTAIVTAALRGRDACLGPRQGNGGTEP